MRSAPARGGSTSTRARASADDGRGRRPTGATRGRRPTHREKLGHEWTYDARAGDGRAGASEGRGSAPVVDRWLSASESDGFEYRGAWLATGRMGGATPDPAFGERLRAMKITAGRYREAGMDASEYAPGGSAYEAFLGEHVLEHVRLARLLYRWRTNFLVRFNREPEFEDMPNAIRHIESNYISLGFRIAEIERL